MTQNVNLAILLSGSSNYKIRLHWPLTREIHLIQQLKGHKQREKQAFSYRWDKNKIEIKQYINNKVYEHSSVLFSNTPMVWSIDIGLQFIQRGIAPDSCSGDVCKETSAETIIQVRIYLLTQQTSVSLQKMLSSSSF